MNPERHPDRKNGIGGFWGFWGSQILPFLDAVSYPQLIPECERC